jgi:hypothetical protein
VFRIGVDPLVSPSPVAWAYIALIWLFVSASTIVTWLVGYGMGYRRGVLDAVTDDIPNGDHRFNGE